MKWLKVHLRKPLSVIVLYSVIFVLGVVSVPSLRFTITPDGYSPVVSVKTQYFGMDSKFIEKTITVPIENALSAIRGIESISSVSEDGQSLVILHISPERSIRTATLEIKSAVDTVAQNFPQDAQESVISHYDPSQTPVMILSYRPSRENMSLMEVRRAVERDVKPLVDKVDGVAECIVTGGKQEEIAVFVDPQRLYSAGLQFRDVNRNIQGNNFSAQLGSVERDGRRTPVFSHGQFGSSYAISGIGVRAEGTNVSDWVRLEQLGETRQHFKRIESISRINGTERVSLYVQKKSGANILQLCGRIREALKNVKMDGVTGDTDFDKSAEIGGSLTNLIVSIFLGVVLLFGITLLFLPDLRKCLIVLIPLPLSLAVTFIVANMAGIELDSIILSGIALGAGLLINNGLVLVVFLSKKMTGIPLRHTLKQVKFLIVPLAASLLTTLCVFIPVLMANAEIRYLYAGFSLVIILMLAISLFLAIGIIPLAYYFWFSRDKAAPRKPATTRLTERTELFYEKALVWLMHNRRRALGAALAAILVCGATLLFRGGDLTASNRVVEIYAYVEPPSGTPLDDTDKYSKEAETILLTRPEVQKVISKVENAHASLIIRLKNTVSEKKAEQLIADYKKALAAVDTFIYLNTGTGSSGDSAKEITVSFGGDDPLKLRELCKQASRSLYSSPNFSDVILRFKDDSPVTRLKPDLAKIQLSGLTLNDAVDEARMFLFGVISSKLNPEGKGMTDIRIAALARNGQPFSLEDLLAIRLRGAGGDLVPFGELFTPQRDSSSTKIFRQNKRRTYSITATLKSGLSLDHGLKAIGDEMKKIPLPEGYFWKFDEKYGKLGKTAAEMAGAILLALFLTFVTLVILSDSFFKAAATLLAIPFAVPGIAVGMFLFGYSFSTPVYIGIILLIGIAVNNGVLLLSDLKPGMVWKDIMNKSRDKLVSILLTTLTTVSGLIPLIFTPGAGQEIWAPFAVTIVFGLLSSTVLKITLLPLLLTMGRRGQTA